VAVLGCAGSGKTTLSRALGERLGLPVVHVDSVHWRTDSRFVAEWPGIHDELIAGDAWIIDGMKPGTLAARLERADTAIFLDLPRRACYRGLLERRLALGRRPGPDPAAHGRIDRALVRWIWRFPREVRPRVLDVLGSASCDVITLSSRGDMGRFLVSLAGGFEDRGHVGADS
jgi:adenylate kinase family enzyme